MWYLKKHTNELTKQSRNRLIDIESKLMVTKGEEHGAVGGGGGEKPI